MIKNTKLLVTISLIVLIIMGIKIFSSKKTIIHLNKNIDNKGEIEIISNNYYTRILPNISNIAKISWLNDNQIEFYGNDNKGEKLHFLFDIENKVLSKDEKEDAKGVYEKSLSFYKAIDNNRKIVYRDTNSNFQDRGLFYLENNKELKLADSIEYMGETKVKFTNDFSKIVFYDSLEGVLKIYNIKNDSLKTLDFILSDYILTNFDEALHFSYDNGYLVLEHVDYKDINKSYFSVFGTDTGKLYADKIYGIKPQWAKESLNISFIYSESDISIHNNGNHIQIAGGRLGVFNLKTRSIKYTESIDKPNKIIGNAIWGNKDDEIYILIGKEKNNKYIPTSIYTFSIKNNTLIDLNYKIDKYLNNSNIRLNEHNNWLVLSDDLEGRMVCIDVKNRRIKSFNGLQKYNLIHLGNVESNLYTFLFDNTFIFLKDNNIFYFNDNVVKNIYNFNSLIMDIYLSPNKDKILIIDKLDTGIELSIIKLNRGI